MLSDKQRALWYVMVFSGVVNWAIELQLRVDGSKNYQFLRKMLNLASRSSQQMKIGIDKNRQQRSDFHILKTENGENLSQEAFRKSLSRVVFLVITYLQELDVFKPNRFYYYLQNKGFWRETCVIVSTFLILIFVDQNSSWICFLI